MVNARQALKGMQAKLESQGEHALPAAVQRMHARILKTITVELVKFEAAIAAMIQATPALPNSPRSSKAFPESPHHLCCADCRHAGAGPSQQ